MGALSPYLRRTYSAREKHTPSRSNTRSTASLWGE